MGTTNHRRMGGRRGTRASEGCGGNRWDQVKPQDKPNTQDEAQDQAQQEEGQEGSDARRSAVSRAPKTVEVGF